MGIKASATCQMSFDDAKGWLVGEPHKGMRAMFTMMNSERLSVGIQGLGAGEAAYQGAVAYAKERLQGRSLVGAKRPDLAADPIIVHPDVRRMLMTIRAYNEGCRALGAWVARSLDVMERHPDPAERRRAEDFSALMTPIVKALFTDLGFESASIGMQVYGGHGFIRDHGMEQYVRDARISMIYEGTNGVQALDLVGRKLPAHAGRFLRSFFPRCSTPWTRRIEDDDLAPLAQPLSKAFGALQLATAHIAQKGLKDPEEAGAAATEYLRLFGLVALGYMWLRSAKVAHTALRAGTDERDFYEAKTTGAVLHGTHPASGGGPAGRREGGQGRDDGARRGDVLRGSFSLTLLRGASYPRPHPEVRESRSKEGSSGLGDPWSSPSRPGKPGTSG